jgi:rhamnulose-1-phosphate aldolase
MQNDRPTMPTDLANIISQLGRAGQRLTELGASEGASGNLSVFLRVPPAAYQGFTCAEDIELPLAVPELAGGTFVVTGSGTRSRDILDSPLSCLGWLEVHVTGRTGTLRSGPQRRFSRLTSEFNSHLAVHRDQVVRHGLEFHAVVHAQPRKVTYLSHIADYQDPETLTRRLLRWQPEAILNFPEGIAVVPFLVPGQDELMLANERALRDRSIVVWSKHGVMARSNVSISVAVDLIEYLETAAAYECLDRMLGSRADGLSPAQMREIAAAYSVKQSLF